ncbi:hypothetical protein QYF61_009301 [Mycteria americana]|uniref:Uncharacterized protein n=1 Tax=Mycteria americana TaxID=33587 RepID=A0AAN7NRJ3_MYCAM|nr:hypothetical protein QYF61_009301 [Mycteria americana]
MEKATLEQVHLRATVAVDESMSQQVYPWRDCGSQIRHHLEQVKRGDSSSLLSTGETHVQCWTPEYKRADTGTSSVKGHKDETESAGNISLEKRRLKTILPMCLKIWWWNEGKGVRLPSVVARWSTLEQVAQTGCGVSIFEDTENPVGHSPEQSDRYRQKPISARQSRVVGRVTTMTQRNSLASNLINWRIPQTDKLNDLTSLTNEQRRFGNGAIFRASRYQTCIYILEKQRKREARKGKEKRGGKRKKKYHHPWILR